MRKDVDFACVYKLINNSLDPGCRRWRRDLVSQEFAPPQEISPLLSKGGRYSYGRLYSFRFAVPDSHSDSNMKIDQVSGE